MIKQSPSVCILDYGSGNVGSVRNLIQALGVDVAVSNAPADIRRASHLVLPGVGAYAMAMHKIGERLPLHDIEREVLAGGKPLLGICCGHAGACQQRSGVW
jgi:glutamine amidotransferase